MPCRLHRQLLHGIDRLISSSAARRQGRAAPGLPLQPTAGADAFCNMGRNATADRHTPCPNSQIPLLPICPPRAMTRCLLQRWTSLCCDLSWTCFPREASPHCPAASCRAAAAAARWRRRPRRRQLPPCTTLPMCRRCLWPPRAPGAAAAAVAALVVRSRLSSQLALGQVAAEVLPQVAAWAAAAPSRTANLFAFALKLFPTILSTSYSVCRQFSPLCCLLCPARLYAAVHVPAVLVVRRLLVPLDAAAFILS